VTETRSDFTVVIPTLNSEKWIASLHDYYATVGLEPLYCLDDKTCDDTAGILTSLGARFTVVGTAIPRVEALVASFKDLVDTPWILRIDDDECPSRYMVEWLRAGSYRTMEPVVSFPRRWLRFASVRRWWPPFGRCERLEFAARKAWDSATSQNGEDRQFRLYQKDAVAYTSRIHSPGFTIEAASSAPGEACLFHFDWVLRSKAERLAKMAHYDIQERGAGTQTAHFYLPEDVTQWDYTGEIHDQDVKRLAQAMRAARAR
jgi:hypothetical protein